MSCMAHPKKRKRDPRALGRLRLEAHKICSATRHGRESFPQRQCLSRINERAYALHLGVSQAPAFRLMCSYIFRSGFAHRYLFRCANVGEYLARMHFRMMERPTYVIRETTGDQSEHQK
jgi:hypothetical protein